jgi:3-deoxy-manno-octulosonate cytidylyltransferase (CMP-KDO synthetase)
MNIIGIIPARFASTRLPGKPLLEIQGKSMIQRVYEQCTKVHSLSYLVVATDDERIQQHVLSFGGNVLMTSMNHNSGTERCADALAQISKPYDVVVNIQGDEPFIEPQQIELLVSCFDDSTTQIATLIKKIDDKQELFDQNRPKVIISTSNHALYFSRQTIPFIRDVPPDDWLTKHVFFKHIGLYAYRVDVLKKIVQLSEHPLEISEKLEQLRWLAHGYSIKTMRTEIDSIGIDTIEDLNRFKTF